MKRSDLLLILEEAEAFLRSGLSRNRPPIDMAEAWSRIFRVRTHLMQDTESLPPITALEAKDGTAQHRHVRKP